MHFVSRIFFCILSNHGKVTYWSFYSLNYRIRILDFYSVKFIQSWNNCLRTVCFIWWTMEWMHIYYLYTYIYILFFLPRFWNQVQITMFSFFKRSGKYCVILSKVKLDLLRMLVFQIFHYGWGEEGELCLLFDAKDTDLLIFLYGFIVF